MSEISEADFRKHMEGVPPEKRRDAMAKLKAAGYTLAGAAPIAPAPSAPPSAGGPSLNPLQPASDVLPNIHPMPAGGEMRPADPMQRLLLSLPKGLTGAGQGGQGMQTDLLGQVASMLGGGSAMGPQGTITTGRAAAAVQPVIQAAAKPVKWTGEVLSEIVARHIGTTPENVEAFFKQYPALRGKITEKVGMVEQANIVEALKDHMKGLGRRFEAIQDSLAGFDGGSKEVPTRVNLQKALDATVAEMKRTGHRIPRAFSNEATVMEGRLDAASPEYKEVLNRLKKLQDNAHTDFGTGLNLKRQIDALIDWGGGQGVPKVSGEGARVLKFMRNQISSELRAGIENPALRKEWDELNGAYTRARTAIEGLHKEVVGATPQQTAMRVMRQIRAGSTKEGMMDRASKVGKAAEEALTEIHDRVIARAFKDRVRSGHTLMDAMSSPRFMGHATGLSGQAYKHVAEASTDALSQPGALAASVSKLMAQHVRTNDPKSGAP